MCQVLVLCMNDSSAHCSKDQAMSSVKKTVETAEKLSQYEGRIPTE